LTELSRYAEGLQRALDLAGGTHSLDDVWLAIEAGDAQFWAYSEHSCIITEIKDYPRKRVLNYWLATGRLEELLDAWAGILPWARQMGCTMATITGRRGWEKTALTNEGWAPSKLTTYLREI
jgi:hypothetical protein